MLVQELAQVLALAPELGPRRATVRASALELARSVPPDQQLVLVLALEPVPELGQQLDSVAVLELALALEPVRESALELD